MCKGSILRRMEIAPLLWLKELGTDRHGRLVPMDTPHYICRTGPVRLPAGRFEFIRKVETVSSRRYMRESGEGQQPVASGNVELGCLERPRYFTAQEFDSLLGQLN